MSYEPELGQMMFGQPWNANECSNHLEAALSLLNEELARIRGNLEGRDASSPFDNSGASFSRPGLPFEVHAYSWGDDEQPFNFKCGDIEVRWYKYFGRGMSVNRKVTPDESAAMLDKCLAALRAWESKEDDRT